MKGKRGLWFGEETGKIIIAVIGIVLMVFLLFKLIGIFIQRTEYEQAKVAMKEIEDTINSLEEGKIGTVLIEGPREWYLVSFKAASNLEKIPKTCGEKNCLCLCPNYFSIKGSKSLFIDSPYEGETAVAGIESYKRGEYGAKNCETKGICVQIKKNLQIEDTWKIRRVYRFFGNREIVDSKIKRDNIPLYPTPLKINFYLDKEKIKISTAEISISPLEIETKIIKIKESPYISEEEKKILFNFFENVSLFEYTFNNQKISKKIKMKDQIVFFYNFFEKEDAVKEILTKNIKDYFSKLNKDFLIEIYKEEQKKDEIKTKPITFDENKKTIFSLAYPGLKEINVSIILS